MSDKDSDDEDALRSDGTFYDVLIFHSESEKLLANLICHKIKQIDLGDGVYPVADTFENAALLGNQEVDDIDHAVEHATFILFFRTKEFFKDEMREFAVNVALDNAIRDRRKSRRWSLIPIDPEIDGKVSRKPHKHCLNSLTGLKVSGKGDFDAEKVRTTLSQKKNVRLEWEKQRNFQAASHQKKVIEGKTAPRQPDIVAETFECTVPKHIDADDVFNNTVPKQLDDDVTPKCLEIVNPSLTFSEADRPVISRLAEEHYPGSGFCGQSSEDASICSSDSVLMSTSSSSESITGLKSPQPLAEMRNSFIAQTDDVCVDMYCNPQMNSPLQISGVADASQYMYQDELVAIIQRTDAISFQKPSSASLVPYNPNISQVQYEGKNLMRNFVYDEAHAQPMNAASSAPPRQFSLSDFSLVREEHTLTDSARESVSCWSQGKNHTTQMDKQQQQQEEEKQQQLQHWPIQQPHEQCPLQQHIQKHQQLEPDQRQYYQQQRWLHQGEHMVTKPDAGFPEIPRSQDYRLSPEERQVHQCPGFSDSADSGKGSSLDREESTDGSLSEDGLFERTGIDGGGPTAVFYSSGAGQRPVGIVTPCPSPHTLP